MPYEHHKAIDGVKHAEAELAAAVSARAYVALCSSSSSSLPHGPLSECVLVCMLVRAHQIRERYLVEKQFAALQAAAAAAATPDGVP